MATPKVDMGIIGNNAANVWSYLMPEETGRVAASLYREMRERDAIIGGTFWALESLFRQVDWVEKPADDSEESKRWATFLRECRADMSHTWPSFIVDVLSMLPYGWAYFEKVYKLRLGPDQQDASKRSRYRDGLLGWRKFALRPQVTLSGWERDADGGIQGMYQNTPAGRVLIPIAKALHFKTAEEGGNPEGRSLLRNARRDYRYQERISQFEAIGIERDLAGLPLIEVPPDLLNLDPEDTSEENALKLRTLQSLERMASGVRQDERAYVMMPAKRIAVVEEDPVTGKETTKEVPSGYSFSLVTSGGTRAHDTDKIIKRYSQRISVSLLATFLLLGGSEGKGTQALSSDLSDFFLTAATGLLDSIVEVLNRFAVADLMQLNGVDPAYWPILEHTGLTRESVTMLVDRLTALMGEGAITPDPELESYLRGALGVPEKPKEQAAAPADQTAAKG